MLSHLSVLLTRPDGVSDKTAAAFQSAGMDVIKEPLMDIIQVQVPNIRFKKYQAILTTSSFAIHSLARLSPERRIPFWCVGDSSRQTAVDFGFQTIHNPGPNDENADGLISAIRKTVDPNQGPLLYAKGDPVRHNLKQTLKTFGYRVDDITLYKSLARKAFSDRAKAFLSEKPVPPMVKGITFYSPRTADIFLNLCEKTGINPPFEHFIALSLSEAISKQLEKFCWLRIITASTTSSLIANVKEQIA